MIRTPPQGSTIISVSVAIVLLLGVIAVAALTLRKRARPPAMQTNASSTLETTDSSASRPSSGYDSQAVADIFSEQYKLLFAVARCDYKILGEHTRVLHAINEAAHASVHQREYFPRRPMLLPKLLRALNDSESTRQEWVRLILSDPALAGSVLERANSAFYRLSMQRVDSLDRAVVLLGTEGLRRLLATAILQPVFRLPEGYFERFAPYTWEQAQRAAGAADAYASLQPGTDPFVAQLLAVLMPLSRIVLFRLTLDKYREAPNILPRSEVFIRAMQTNTAIVARDIAAQWELSEPAIAALEAQVQHLSPAEMPTLARSVYFAELSSALAVLARHGRADAQAAPTILLEQGMEAQAVIPVWEAATSAA